MSKRIKNLTPKKAWDIYVDTPVKIFISNYMAVRRIKVKKVICRFTF